jgi:RimJ/RimL family protein N-acetyltransferase
LIDTALARRRLRALYRHDRRGRLVAVNEWSGGTPPRLHLMRTESAVLAGVRNDVPDDVAAKLKTIARCEPPALTEAPAEASGFLAALGAERVLWSGPAFLFPDSLPAETEAVAIGPHNAELLTDVLSRWLPDVGKRGPLLAMVGEGRALAVCASVRITPFVHCAGVETDPDHRGRGLASRAVTAWAAQVRALGATPFYSTSWDNLASRGVARRLGLTLAAVDFHD